ncbi:MAG: hypothetical protein JRD89_01880 [Deltaproteobacteria bacterium]|nr:hypothetical protein [Deltaproteobacteria bacterium]
MAAQHKRPGRKAKEERKRRAAEREARKNLKVIVGYPRRGEARDDFNVGRLVIWAEVVNVDQGKKEKRSIPAAADADVGRKGRARAAQGFK